MKKQYIYAHTKFEIEKRDGVLEVFCEGQSIGRAGGTSIAKSYDKRFTNSTGNHVVEDGLIRNTANYHSIADAVNDLCQ